MKKHRQQQSFIKELWDVLVERNKVHKALRLLSQQEWSVEFLIALVARAARIDHRPIEIEIMSPIGARLIIRSSDITPAALNDDDIFNHLDDEVKLRAFTEAVNRK